jgi:hypothetical protein
MTAAADLASGIRRFSGYALTGEEAAAASQSLAGFIRLLIRIDKGEETTDATIGIAAPKRPKTRKASCKSPSRRRNG